MPRKLLALIDRAVRPIAVKLKPQRCKDLAVLFLRVTELRTPEAFDRIHEGQAFELLCGLEDQRKRRGRVICIVNIHFEGIQTGTRKHRIDESNDMHVTQR